MTVSPVGSEVFVDSSALYAVLDRDDHAHERAARAFTVLLDHAERGESTLVTHGAVVHEAVALVQRRLGMRQVRQLVVDLCPLFEVVWVDAVLHARAVESLLAADRRGLSSVDWISFLVMRDRAIETAFAFDDDFIDQGFAVFEA